ncbi:MAG: hypothetical protein R6V14_06110 [Halanaerobiales bacterium]
MNREHFGSFLITAAILFLIGYVIYIFFYYFTRFMFEVLAVSVAFANFVFFIGTIIQSILIVTGSVFLILHGSKEEDKFMLTAGILRIIYIGWLFISLFIT